MSNKQQEPGFEKFALLQFKRGARNYCKFWTTYPKTITEYYKPNINPGPGDSLWQLLYTDILTKKNPFTVMDKKMVVFTSTIGKTTFENHKTFYLLLFLKDHRKTSFWTEDKYLEKFNLLTTEQEVIGAVKNKLKI